MSGSENYCEDNSEGGPTGSRERTCSFKQGGRSGRAPLRRRHLKREEESLAKLCEKTAWQRGRRVQRARGGRIRGRGRGQGQARRWCDRSGVNDRERERDTERRTHRQKSADPRGGAGAVPAWPVFSSAKWVFGCPAFPGTQLAGSIKEAGRGGP